MSPTALETITSWSGPPLPLSKIHTSAFNVFLEGQKSLTDHSVFDPTYMSIHPFSTNQIGEAVSRDEEPEEDKRPPTPPPPRRNYSESSSNDDRNRYMSTGHFNPFAHAHKSANQAVICSCPSLEADKGKWRGDWRRRHEAGLLKSCLCL